VRSTKLVATQLPVVGVSVFVDRAEVTRTITITAGELGQHECVVEGLADHIHAESIRFVWCYTRAVLCCAVLCCAVLSCAVA
jgi:hypothetical protein